MKNFNIYCMCLHDHHLNNLKKLNYVPVGLGQNSFTNEWLRDKTGENISSKNKFYGEYTFYYWFWKNLLQKLSSNEWVGFTGYRYHWSNSNKIGSDEINKIINKENFNEFILKKIPKEWENHKVILGEEIFINNWKISKVLKHGKKQFLLNPKFFLKKNRNIKLHFDVFHGENILDRAINIMDENDREDFRKFVNEKVSFNRENLFFCNSKEIMNNYFNSIFSWLKKCEDILGFSLKGYGQTRMYAFLAERYLSFWFNKYTKPLTWPIFFFDTNKEKINL